MCSGFVGEKSGAERAVFEVFEAKFSGYRASILVLLSPASTLPGPRGGVNKNKEGGVMPCGGSGRE